MRRLTRLAAPAMVLASVIGAACASMETPPGGPPDAAPAVLVRVTPESGAVNVRPRGAVFQFNEVIAERQTSGTLADLFLISPADRATDVDWNRTSVQVRPDRGWRPNTTYTVSLLPGLADLRGNIRREGATIVFSTGPEIASAAVSGIVFDWVAGRVVPLARVEAISRPDSTVYVGRSDSSGMFVIPNIPDGDYTVRGLADANRNRALDPRELWDSVRVTVSDSARVELLMHAHDTVPPRIDRVVVRDSFTLRVTVDRPLDPALIIDTSLFRLTGSDSAAIPLATARGAQVFEREQAERDRATADSAARAAPPLPTGARANDPRPATIAAVTPSRASPVTELIIIVARPLQAGATYRLSAGMLRGIMGTERGSERTFTLPEPPPPRPATATPPGAATTPPPPPQ